MYRPLDEARLHEVLRKLKGEYRLITEWGEITVRIEPVRLGFRGVRGRPDELLVLEVKLPVLGEPISITVPVLIEVETRGGFNAALKDLRAFSERTRRGELNYIKIPFLILGRRRRTEILSPVEIGAEIEAKEIRNLFPIPTEEQ